MYMMELYMDKLIDLFAAGKGGKEDKLDIKKDKKACFSISLSLLF